MSRYADVKSFQKDEMNEKVADMIKKVGGEGKIAILDAKHLRTTSALIDGIYGKPIDPSRIVVVEKDENTMKMQRDLVAGDHKFKGVELRYKDAFDILTKIPNCPVAYLDAMVSDFDAEQVSEIEKWNKSHGRRRHAMMFTLSAGRVKRRRSLGARASHICGQITGMHPHFMHGYQRNPGKSMNMMTVLIASWRPKDGRCEYTPHKIIGKQGDLFKVTWRGFAKSDFTCETKNSDPVQMLLQK